MSEAQENAGKCPVAHDRAPHPTQGGGNRQWWPEGLNLKILAKNPTVSNPLDEGFDYAEAFQNLDLAAVKRDIAEVLTTSQDWWPAADLLPRPTIADTPVLVVRAKPRIAMPMPPDWE
ncbi:hypothetical protein ACWC2H_22890, partial [Streptomyces sp. 900105755]